MVCDPPSDQKSWHLQVEMTGLLEEPASTDESRPSTLAASQNLPKGVVLDKDGKPCRTCTSSAAWLSMMKSSTSKKTSTASATTATAIPAAAAATAIDTDLASSSSSADCPPDVEQLGRSTWTLLHSLTATYPETPTPQQKSNVSQFLSLFSQLYPCWVCAEDFRDWMNTPGNAPRLSNQDEFGRWMCQAHNAVNVKLGKKEFNCDLWRERWKDGWKDGRCG